MGDTHSDGDSVTVTINACSEAKLPNARNCITCEVDEDGALVLIPRDALAARFLRQFGNGSRIRPVWTMRPGASDSRPSRPAPISQLRLEDDGKAPVLSSGGDPYWTGVSLSPEEAKACRALIDKMRGRTPTCNAQTTAGGWCKRAVTVEGDHCYAHREPAP